MSGEIILNTEAFCGNQDDYNALDEAIKKLSSASEEQFESIKKEKWYNRVFDLVTFSQKGKKRIAEQVGTLAQAQQILIELLTRLSDKDSNVSDLVVKSMDDIKKLSEQNIYLLQKIKKLENISLGMKTDMDIKNLSESNKKILSACLHLISDKNENPSNSQQTFANKVINYLDVDVQMDNPLANVDEMNSETRKKILNCCMEYMFLKDCSNSWYSSYEKFISEFDFGSKTISSIKKQIMSLYKLRGEDGFFSKYQNENFEFIDDSFSVDIAGLESEEEFELQDETIMYPILVKAGETKTFKDKNLHFNANIQCDGELIFDHCVINYNETNAANEIVMQMDSKLSIQNSVVICKGYNEHKFIKCNGCSQLTISGTSFEDCSYFVEGHLKPPLSSCQPGVFSMSGCYLHNCYHGFVHVLSAECNISNNIIRYLQSF